MAISPAVWYAGCNTLPVKEGLIISITIGIDAGGTYTDVVVYSTEDRKLIGHAKALTTKEDLSVGIREALDRVDVAALRRAERISLSTTLATNACVEEKGGNGKLLFVDVDPDIVDWVGGSYGLPAREDILFMDQAAVDAPEAFFRKNRAWLRDADGIAVVDINAADRSTAPERALRAYIESAFDIPVICGHELYNELNSLRRGASTLLNVRLIPVIAAFLQAIRTSLAERGIEAPVSIVRSDGTIMSEKFTRVRPVETLLCGPAAGLVGVEHMVTEPDCLVLDMGGTTTDISIIREHSPLRAGDGIQIGRWRTFAKGVFVDTFGLGGDSTVYADKERGLVLGARRSVPLCMAADRWPHIKTELRRMIAETGKHTQPMHEFFMLAREMDRDARCTGGEKQLCRRLEEGPLIFRDAAAAMGTDIYNLNRQVARLEREGFVLRCGLTPTDIMHLKGDFSVFDTEASRMGALFLSACTGQTRAQLEDRVYHLVKKKLYGNIVRVLLQQQYPALRKNGLDAGLQLMIDEGWEAAAKGGAAGLLQMQFRTPAALVGIGAPIHIFLPDVAAALSAEYVIPEYAAVANALGAAVSQVEVVCRVEVRAIQGDAGDTFRVAGPYETFETELRDAAVANALDQAKRAACDEAARRGLEKADRLETKVTHRECMIGYGYEMYLGSVVEATVSSGGK